MRMLRTRGNAKYNYGKRVYRKYKTLDEQRASAENKLKFTAEPGKPAPTKEEMFQQVANMEDLITVVQLIVGGDKDRVARIIRTLADYSVFAGQDPLWKMHYDSTKSALYKQNCERLARGRATRQENASEKRLAKKQQEKELSRFIGGNDSSKNKKTRDERVLIVGRNEKGELIEMVTSRTIVELAKAERRNGKLYTPG